MDKFLSELDCQRILKVEFPKGLIKVHDYYFEDFENIGEGFLSSIKKLVIEFSHGNSGNIQKHFFTKMLPQGNKFHEEWVVSTKVFAKEVFFFDKVKPNLDLWSKIEVIPKCYLAVPNKILVLELISKFSCKNLSKHLDEKEIRSAIKSVAVLHSASMMCESKNGIDPKSVWGDYFFDALYLRQEHHLGFRHTCMGITAIKAIMETFYKGLDKRLIEYIYSLYDNLPEHILPSKKYRNVISHGDLYSNNIMFSTSTTAEVESKIVDFQFFRFCPPALDLLTMIFVNSESNKSIDLNDLTNYYYECTTSILTEYGFQVSTELPHEEFQESIKTYRSLAIAITLLFQQYLNLPPEQLKEIMDDDKLLRKFILENRNDIVLSSFETNNNYKNKLQSTIKLLIESSNNDLK